MPHRSVVGCPPTAEPERDRAVADPQPVVEDEKAGIDRPQPPRGPKRHLLGSVDGPRGQEKQRRHDERGGPLHASPSVTKITPDGASSSSTVRRAASSRWIRG